MPGWEILSSTDAFLVMLAYTFQLYFDFSGYCDMAMGISRMFNLELPLNFNSPLQSAVSGGILEALAHRH